MTRRSLVLTWWDRHRQVAPAAVVALGTVLLAIYPVPLLPLAHAYEAICQRYPVLTLLAFHPPAAPLALLMSLAGLGLAVGAVATAVAVAQTRRFNHRLRRGATTVPPRLARLAGELGIADRITFLDWAPPAACCFGVRHAQIAITAGLVSQLDDAELVAVLAHERQHLRRHDPLRYLVLYALSTAAFMVPVAPALRRRQEARIELAADRAALEVVSSGALAGALLSVLSAPRLPVHGVASLTATEARIAHLSGRGAELPEIPDRLVAASVGLAATVAAAMVHLAATTRLADMVCQYCRVVVSMTGLGW
jgi:Zn-dependent protease with chaperone function